MTLYLSSYALGNDVSYLKKWIKEKGKDIIFISNAHDNDIDEEDYEDKMKDKIKLLESVGFNVKKIDLKEYFTNNKKLLDDIKGYNVFFIRGGNTFILRKAFELSSFDKFLINNKDKDILYIGESAGCCILSKTLDGVDIEDEPINIYNDDKVPYDGLGLIDFSPVPHYKSEYVDQTIINDTIEYLKSKNIKYKTIRDGDVIIINI